MPRVPTLDKPLRTAWLWLAGLSALAALVSSAMGGSLPRQIAGAVILALALAKARLILSRYLGLGNAPDWLRGFFGATSLWALLVLGLYLAPGLMP